MLKADTLLPAEITRFSGKTLRNSAEKGLSEARSAYDKFNASAKDAAGSFDCCAAALARGLSEFNAKAFAAYCANTSAALDFMTSLAGARSPTEIVALQSDFVEKQFKNLNEQAKDLSDLARKVATESVEPIKSHWEKALKSVA